MRWERNERVRRLALERDRERPPAELLAETIELSRVSMRLAAGGSFQLATAHGQLDILQEGGAIPLYSTLAETAPEAEYEGLALRYCSRDHLIEMKRRAARPRDLLDLEELDVADGGEGGPVRR